MQVVRGSRDSYYSMRVRGDAGPTVPEEEELLFTQLLFSYRVHAQTGLFLSYSENRQGMTPTRRSSCLRRETRVENRRLGRREALWGGRRNIRRMGPATQAPRSAKGRLDPTPTLDTEGKPARRLMTVRCRPRRLHRRISTLSAKVGVTPASCQVIARRFTAIDEWPGTPPGPTPRAEC